MKDSHYSRKKALRDRLSHWLYRLADRLSPPAPFRCQLSFDNGGRRAKADVLDSGDVIRFFPWRGGVSIACGDARRSSYWLDLTKSIDCTYKTFWGHVQLHIRGLASVRDGRVDTAVPEVEILRKTG
jgi:hypothetical protein